MRKTAMLLSFDDFTKSVFEHLVTEDADGYAWERGWDNGENIEFSSFTDVVKAHTEYVMSNLTDIEFYGLAAQYIQNNIGTHAGRIALNRLFMTSDIGPGSRDEAHARPMNIRETFQEYISKYTAHAVIDRLVHSRYEERISNFLKGMVPENNRGEQNRLEGIRTNIRSWYDEWEGYKKNYNPDYEASGFDALSGLKR